MAERFELVEKALVKMLEEKKYATLRDILITMNPADVAGLFSDLEDQKIPLLFRLLPKELAAETFVEMETDDQEPTPKGRPCHTIERLSGPSSAHLPRWRCCPPIRY